LEFPRNKKRLTALGIILLGVTANFIGIGRSLTVRWSIYLCWVIALVISAILTTAAQKEEQEDQP
jgi:hypothetical protein